MRWCQLAAAAAVWLRGWRASADAEDMPGTPRSTSRGVESAEDNQMAARHQRSERLREPADPRIGRCCTTRRNWR